ncbi:MAG: hypothetical protein WD048_02040 [Chitinophagales bacterium]
MAEVDNTNQQEEQEGGNKKSFYLVLIVLLILLNGFFAFNHWSTKKELQKVEGERNELDSLYNYVQAELNANELKLDSMTGQYIQVDSLLELRVAELSAAKAEIEELMRKNKLNLNEISYLKKKILKLNQDNKAYLAQIDSLSAEVEYLTLVKDSLSTDLASEREANKQLQSERTLLSEKVALGSLLRPENIEATGIRIRGNGSERETNRSNRTDKLRFCFDIPENPVAEKGEKTILLRLLNPEGATVAIKSEGSGIFVVAETGEQMQYTTKGTFEYEGKRKSVCMYWNQTNPYSSGTYIAYFYQDGHLLKEQKFELN